jgi:hypothetical protein
MALPEQRPTDTGPITDESSDDTADGLSSPLRCVLAACLVGAACIHLAMVPTHAGEWLAEGIAFALAGWLQPALAVAIVVRPSRMILAVCAVANLVFIVAWAWTRTAGPPFGPEAGIQHRTGFVDITCVVLEAAVVVFACVALARPRLGSRLDSSGLVLLSAIPVVIVALATTAIVSPSATQHDHAAADDHDHNAMSAPTDHSATPMDHSHTTDAAATPTAAAGDHEHGNDHGNASATAAPVDDSGLALLANGEMAHMYGPDQPLDATTQTVLRHQLALTRLISDRFPTLKDAMDHGSTHQGAFGPGLGIHMSIPTSNMPDGPAPDQSLPVIPGTLTDAQIMHPANLMYAGTDSDSPIAGFMYTAMAAGEPEGFAGPNDHWHTHGKLCIKMNGPGGKIEVLHNAEKTPEGCTSAGGMFIPQTTYMVHVWTVPGYESNRGVFSDINPSLTCPDGTYYSVPQQDADKYQLNSCRSNPS